MSFQIYKSFVRLPPTGSISGSVPVWAQSSVFVKSGSTKTTYNSATASVSASYAAAQYDLTGGGPFGTETWRDRRRMGDYWYASEAGGELIIRERVTGNKIVYSTAYNQTAQYVAAGDLNEYTAIHKSSGFSVGAPSTNVADSGEAG